MAAVRALGMDIPRTKQRRERIESGKAGAGTSQLVQPFRTSVGEYPSLFE